MPSRPNPAADQCFLRGVADAQCDVGFASGQVQGSVRNDHFQFDPWLRCMEGRQMRRQ
jgi:hypothetical protein